MYNDAVSSYALIKRYRTTEYAISNSGWTLLDAAEQVFKLAKDRIYNAQDGKFFKIHFYFQKDLLINFQNLSQNHVPNGSIWLTF